MILVLNIIIQLLLILGVLFLGTIIFVFCIMINDKGDTDNGNGY